MKLYRMLNPYKILKATIVPALWFGRSEMAHLFIRKNLYDADIIDCKETTLKL